MLLNSGYVAPAHATTNMPTYTTVDSLLEDVSRQMAHMGSSNLSRRHSRGSMGQRPGNSTVHSMRIVKPSSANSSPQRSLASARRRTMMNDGLNYRRPSLLEQPNIANGGYEGFQNPVRSSRPVSWHPSSQLASQATYASVPTFAHHVDTGCLPYSPSVYSGYNSPATSLSPGCVPYNDNTNQQYQSTNMSSFYQPSYEIHTPAPVPSYAISTGHPQYPQQAYDPSMYSHFDWNNFTHNGFHTVTTPPTPENFLPIQHHEPSLHVEESIPYHPLDEAEEEGEELVGLGLYDTPEKPSSETNLNNYHRALVSYTFEAGHRKQESMGKGLKLEETWNPPASDDEDGDDVDD